MPADWLIKANAASTGLCRPSRPAESTDPDTARMLPLPPVDPPGWWRSTPRLPRDHYVRLDTVTSAGQILNRNTYDGFNHITQTLTTKSTGTQQTTDYTFDPLDRTTSQGAVREPLSSSVVA